MRLTPTLPAGFAASSSEMLFSVNRPGLVALKGPGGAQTDHTPTYTWEMDPGASRYQLTVTDRATGMTVVNRTYDASDVCPCGDDCRVTPRDALTDGRFLWQLRPGDPDEWGTWRGMSFSLSAPLTPSNGTYSLKVDSTGKCLDADSGEDHLNGGTVQLWSCHFGSNQSWRLERRNTEEF